ncbi:hypothetical protein [Citricoccus muralis]|uniref:Uncharacterized protein n=1 Tax=Citricoccus muralis TaxID=169134 RepID=A0ABY8H703_9MICC|nr:hypothetical protein [Citricoccus muralis]WFP16706.1 hypothetical protein P8192_00840 [Citricoccus muralis]
MTNPSIPKILAQRLSEEIQPQRAFGWKKEPWLKIVSDAPEVVATLNDFPDKLDREVVRKVVQEKLAQEQVLAAFIPVLIWGGPGGYGPFRARSILTGVGTSANSQASINPAVAEKLRNAADIVRQPDHVAAYSYMSNDGRVKHLGGAFFTKWLSFASMTSSIDGPDVAPILDKRVSDWIFEQTSGEVTIGKKIRSTPDYRTYLELLDSWGGDHNRTRAQVELAIFELTRDRPAD